MPLYYKPLAAEPDAGDWALHQNLCNPELVTRRLGELVPLLKFVGFRVDQMTPEKTILSVPLLETPMNQNGTHQAAVFYILADYTLGVGMFAALPGCYTVGVHDRCNALPVQFWLKSGHVRHLAPGTGTIRGEISLAPEVVSSMRTQLIAKGRCEIKETVRIYQGDKLVAETEHEMGLYADLPRVENSRASVAQVHRHKGSALMIAGLRTDPFSHALAGDQGVAIARRMSRATPQLAALVAARSKHVSDCLTDSRRAFRQILVLGVGLDTKPIEFASPDQPWYICDLLGMLQERDRRLAEAKRNNPSVVSVPVDLRLAGWTDSVLNAGFDRSKPTLVILEGVSMYLEMPELQKLISNIRALFDHPESCLWFDHVTDEILTMDRPEVRAFLSSMARLGEPFVTGFSNPIESIGRGWRLVSNATAAGILGTDDPVHREYHFTLMAAQ